MNKSNHILHVGMKYFSDELNHLKINSINEYIIFDDLLRPLVRIDSHGKAVGDLASSWRITNSCKNYEFTIKENQYFSDGSIITVKDILDSFESLIFSPEIVHGDGRKIKNVTGLDASRFQIELFKTDPFFLEELSSPEHRIIKKDCTDYKITSGPYSIEGRDEKNVYFNINQHYSFPEEVKYQKVHFHQYDSDKLIKEDLFKQFDIFWPKSTMSQEENIKIRNNKYYFYEMNLGFSMWLSLNPISLKISERIYLKKKFDLFWEKSSFFKGNENNRSFQLFLPKGPGRLSASEIDLISNSLKEETKIKKLMNVLLPKNIDLEILKSIESLELKFQIDYFENFDEYALMIKNKTYDLLFVNNDHSAVDLRLSIGVTFNNSRPLVFTDDNYVGLLDSIKSEQNSVSRFELIKKLSEKVLTDVIVYPLYLKTATMVVREGIDLSKLDNVAIETSAWKMR